MSRWKQPVTRQDVLWMLALIIALAGLLWGGEAVGHVGIAVMMGLLLYCGARMLRDLRQGAPAQRRSAAWALCALAALQVYFAIKYLPEELDGWREMLELALLGLGVFALFRSERVAPSEPE